MNNRNLKSSGFCSAAEEPDSHEPTVDRADEKGRQLVGDMPWVTSHLTDDQIEDLKKQVASCLRHFNDELLQWLRKREGEVESLKDRTPSAPKKASLGGQAKAYKDVHQFIEQRLKG